MTPTDSDNVLNALETPEEATERAELETRRRGRPAGSKNKPKLSDETLTLGCIQLVRLCWFMARLPALLLGGDLTPLSADDEKQGAEEAKPLILRFTLLVIVLMILGFPLWLIRTAVAHFKRKPESKADAKVLPLAPEASDEQVRIVKGGAA